MAIVEPQSDKMEYSVTTATALPRRQDVPPEHTWNVQSIYATDDLWENDFQAIERQLPELEALAGTLGAGPDALLAAIQRIHRAQMLLEQAWVYASLRRDEDMTNPTYQSFAERISMLAAKFGSVTAFFEPELLALPDEQIDSYLAQNTDLQLY